MHSPVSNLLSARPTPRRAFADAFRRQLKAIEAGTHRCWIPRQRGLYEKHPRMHYHFMPELFVQLGGVTEFTFPDEHCTLRSGEICLVPKGLPHAEFVRGEREPFENIVVSFYNDMIDVHVAHEVGYGHPAADEVHFFQTGIYADLIRFLDCVCDLHHHGGAQNARAITGLLIAEFSLLLTIVEAPAAHPPATTDIITRCQWLVQHNLQEETLSLESLAAELGCSPNYLSKLFHRRTGERLVEHINRLRVENAVEVLRHSRLSVKAVAAACGFGDANYFARVFRQATGRSPQQFRAAFQRPAQAGALPPMARTRAHAVDESVTIDGELAVRDAELAADRCD
jgi:AraC-like DNA-binding protein/mannose-6-phosphate isomerase-like protein (cupin superfamily)